MNIKSILPLVVLFAVSQAHAVLTSAINPFDNATVKPAGPRTGGSGKSFFNVEGDNNTTNASYGVLDFNTSGFSLGTSVSSVSSLTLTLVESNAAFTLPGSLSFYISTDTTTSIQPTNTALTYLSPSASNNGGVGTNLSTLYFLGTGDFTTTGNVNTGTADLYAFDLGSLAPAAQTYLTNTLNAGGTLRVVITPNDTSIAATWGGYNNTNGYIPQLQLDYAAVPEPGMVGLMALGGSFLLWRLRRREATR